MYNIKLFSYLVIICTIFLIITPVKADIEFDPEYITAEEAAGDYSDSDFDSGGVLQYYTQLGSNDPANISYSIINWSLMFLGIITVALIIVAGFMWIFAAGNEEKITKSQDIIKGSIIGLLLIMASFGIAQYVFNKIVEITGPTTTEQTTQEQKTFDETYSDYTDSIIE